MCENKRFSKDALLSFMDTTEKTNLGEFFTELDLDELRLFELLDTDIADQTLRFKLSFRSLEKAFEVLKIVLKNDFIVQFHQPMWLLRIQNLLQSLISHIHKLLRRRYLHIRKTCQVIIISTMTKCSKIQTIVINRKSIRRKSEKRKYYLPRNLKKSVNFHGPIRLFLNLTN